MPGPVATAISAGAALSTRIIPRRLDRQWHCAPLRIALMVVCAALDVVSSRRVPVGLQPHDVDLLPTRVPLGSAM
jgi:hypothetical protein